MDQKKVRVWILFTQWWPVNQDKLFPLQILSRHYFLMRNKKERENIILIGYIKDKSSISNTQKLRFDKIIEIHHWNLWKRQQIIDLFYTVSVPERMVSRNSLFYERKLFETMDINKIWMKLEIQQPERHIAVYRLERIWEPEKKLERLLKAQILRKYDVTSKSRSRVFTEQFLHLLEIIFMTITFTWQKSSLWKYCDKIVILRFEVIDVCKQKTNDFCITFDIHSNQRTFIASILLHKNLLQYLWNQETKNTSS